MLTKREKVFNFIDKYILLIPIIFAIAVIPLIVRVAYYDLQLAQYSWFAPYVKFTDMFMYHKNKAMMLLDGVLVIGYIYLLIRKKMVVSLRFLPLFFYFVLTILSSIASVAPAQTWNGFYGMLESAYAAFGYCLICYFAFVVVRTEKQLKWVMGAFAVGTLVMGMIAVSQFTGMDFYDTDLGKDLIFPKELAEYKDALTTMAGDREVYASLYNSNYVGVYSCLLVPVVFVLMFSVKGKLQAVVCTILMAFVLVCLVGSGSQAAILALLACILFAVFYYGKKHWKTIIPTLILCLGIFAGLNMYQGEKNSVTDTVNQVTGDLPANSTVSMGSKIADITLNDTDYTITYNEEILTVKYYRNDETFLDLRVYDSNGNELEKKDNEEKSGYVLADEKYEGLEFVFGKDANMNSGFWIKVGESGLFIYYSEINGTYLYTNYYGRPTKLYSSETFYSPFFDLMGGFSGRDFIWSKSIPVLKETIILGSGPDTFAFMFPQYDYVDLIQDGWEGLLITKPHSLYLQIGIQTGVLSLIAFLLFNILYIVQSLRLFYKRTLNTFTERCGAGIFIAVICYLIAGLLNDSTIGVSIIYWTLLGIGFACNHMILYPNYCVVDESMEIQENLQEGS